MCGIGIGVGSVGRKEALYKDDEFGYGILMRYPVGG
jgi:hypothetical protein